VLPVRQSSVWISPQTMRRSIRSVVRRGDLLRLWTCPLEAPLWDRHHLREAGPWVWCPPPAARCYRGDAIYFRRPQYSGTYLTPPRGGSLHAQFPPKWWHTIGGPTLCAWEYIPPYFSLATIGGDEYVGPPRYRGCGSPHKLLLSRVWVGKIPACAARDFRRGELFYAPRIRGLRPV